MKDFLSSYFGRKSKNDQVEQIHKAARKYFGKDFPNSQREDCPPQELFHKLIREKSLPDNEFQNHLFTCSNCFNDFQAAMQRERISDTQSKAAFQFPIRPLLASGIVVVSIAVGVLFWSWSNNSDSLPSVSKNNGTDAPVIFTAQNSRIKESNQNQPKITAENNIATANLNNQINHLSNKKQSTPKENEPKILAKNEVEINLNQPVWRDSEIKTNQKFINLEAKKIRLRIKLPKENPAGIYEVYTVDEFGKTLSQKNLVTAKNHTLNADFDLRKITGQKNRLCFAPVGEIPDCILMKISSVRKE